jgi:hypothetical protein
MSVVQAMSLTVTQADVLYDVPALVQRLPPLVTPGNGSRGANPLRKNGSSAAAALTRPPLHIS